MLWRLRQEGCIGHLHYLLVARCAWVVCLELGGTSAILPLGTLGDMEAEQLR